MHHAMNHIGFMISPELYVVQDRVHDSPEPRWIQGQSPEPRWIQGQGPEPYMVQGAIRNPQ